MDNSDLLKDPHLTYGVMNRGLRKLPNLDIFMGGDTLPLKAFSSKKPDAILGWGRRKFSERAARYAAKAVLPFIRIEDGFLRSIGLGNQDPPLSIVVDDLGIYYDAHNPSRLEELIKTVRTDDELERARQLQRLWSDNRLSKYNLAREVAPPVSGPFVLVVDQTYQDASISYGLADSESFRRMLEAALDEYPRYLDPETRTLCQPERLMDWMGFQRQMRGRFEPLCVISPLLANIYLHYVLDLRTERWRRKTATKDAIIVR